MRADLPDRPQARPDAGCHPYSPGIHCTSCDALVGALAYANLRGEPARGGVIRGLKGAAPVLSQAPTHLNGQRMRSARLDLYTKLPFRGSRGGRMRLSHSERTWAPRGGTVVLRGPRSGSRGRVPCPRTVRKIASPAREQPSALITFAQVSTHVPATTTDSQSRRHPSRPTGQPVRTTL